MAKFSEQTLAEWTGPSSESEDEKRDRTEGRIRDAIRAHPNLGVGRCKIYAKGSYRNNTNVRADSDVDIAVELTTFFDAEYADGVSDANTGNFPYSGSDDRITFKNEVGAALTNEFGTDVSRRNKVFVARQSSTGLAADVVPCVSYRWYPATTYYEPGIRLIPDRGLPVENFPEQHYSRGVQKNDSVDKRFKRLVRIVKRLENRMVKDGYPEVASFLMESLVFNVQDSTFKSAANWIVMLHNALYEIWTATKTPDCEKTWFEVNRIKYLFHQNQRWTRAQANAFAAQAYAYMEF